MTTQAEQRGIYKMIRDKEIEALQGQIENIQRLYDYTLNENKKLRLEIEELKSGQNAYIKQLKADMGILERTVDIYVRKLAEARTARR